MLSTSNGTSRPLVTLPQGQQRTWLAIMAGILGMLFVYVTTLSTLEKTCVRMNVNDDSSHHAQSRTQSPAQTVAFKSPCDPETELLLFQKSGGSRGTNCPDNTVWMKRFMQSDPNPDKLFIVIGCNKGVDAVNLFSLFDNSEKPFQAETWKKTLRTKTGDGGACHQVVATGIPDKKKPDASLPKRAPTVYCLEPMPSTIKLLKETAEEAKINTAEFRILQFAIGNTSEPGFVYFPNTRPGTENLGISNSANGNSIKVAFTSVDILFSTRAQAQPIDMLLIDTEGNDPDVLFGAKSILPRVRYLEFEVHRDLRTTAWGKNSLEKVIEFLDSFGFECYWSNNKGQLFQITNCWHPDYEKAAYTWSNVVCGNVNDPWHAILRDVHQSKK